MKYCRLGLRGVLGIKNPHFQQRLNPNVGSPMWAECSNKQPQSFVGTSRSQDSLQIRWYTHTDTHQHTQIYNPSTQVLSLDLPD